MKVVHPAEELWPGKKEGEWMLVSSKENFDL